VDLKRGAVIPPRRNLVRVPLLGYLSSVAIAILVRISYILWPCFRGSICCNRYWLAPAVIMGFLGGEFGAVDTFRIVDWHFDNILLRIHILWHFSYHNFGHFHSGYYWNFLVLTCFRKTKVAVPLD
jgi:hypothetical protein